MKYSNSKYTIVLPLIVSVSVLIGIFIGKHFGTNANEQYAFSVNSSQNKLGLILDYIENEYVDSVSKKDMIEKVIPLILEQLDPHSAYIPAEEFNDMNDPLEGEFEGIGVQFNIQKDTVVIIQVISGGPSERVRMQAGDRIVTVNDSVIAGIGIKSSDVVKLLKGPKGTKVEVGVARRSADSLIVFEITRDKIPLYSIDVAYMPTPQIGYIKLSRFAMTTIDEFEKNVTDLKSQGMKKLILDLRGNGGGILQSAIQLANNFLKAGSVITYTQGKAYPRKYYNADKDGLCKDIELVILIDEGSASASEVLAGAIQDNDRGTIIGRRSFGKGLVMDQREFNDGSAIRLTIQRYYSPTGRCIQKPYDEGTEVYYHEIEKRFKNGELEEKDSVHFPDSLKFVTPAGKIVYGGGGIMPDIFIPLDTLGYTDYLSQITNKGLVYQFAFDFSDSHRAKMSSLKTVSDFRKYLQTQDVLQKFVSYAQEAGVKPNKKEIAISKDILTNSIEASVIRNILDDKGFYPVILEQDKAFTKALEVLK